MACAWGSWGHRAVVFGQIKGDAVDAVSVPFLFAPNHGDTEDTEFVGSHAQSPLCSE